MKNDHNEVEPNEEAPEITGDAGATIEPLESAATPDAETAELKNQVAQLQNQLLRVSADFDNYKKRAARERQEGIKYAQESLLQRLIPVLDNFEMAQAAGQAQNISVASLQSGIAMVQQQLKSTLNEAGLEELDATGKAFDPNLHEALSQEESADIPEGHVLRQLRKGYKLRERLLRPASVVVARPPAA